MAELTLRKTQIARKAIEKHFKEAFHEAMKKYAPIKDGWLRSCGMFRVTARWVGSDYRAIQITVDERPKYVQQKKLLYWRAVENGSVLPRAKRWWILDKADDKFSRNNMTARLLMIKKRAVGRYDYYYNYRNVTGGAFENARVSEHTKHVGWSNFTPKRNSMKRVDPYDNPIGGWVGKKQGRDWNGLIGQRRMWMTQGEIRRKGKPFMTAVCMDAVKSTRAAINAAMLRTYGLRPTLMGSTAFLGKLDRAGYQAAHKRLRIQENKQRLAELRKVRPSKKVAKISKIGNPNVRYSYKRGMSADYWDVRRQKIDALQADPRSWMSDELRGRMESWRYERGSIHSPYREVPGFAKEWNAFSKMWDIDVMQLPSGHWY